MCQHPVTPSPQRSHSSSLFARIKVYALVNEDLSPSTATSLSMKLPLFLVLRLFLENMPPRRPPLPLLLDLDAAPPAQKSTVAMK